jgi:hypothetical protein
MLQLVGDKGSSSALELQDATAPADCFLRGVHIGALEQDVHTVHSIL